MRSRNKIGSSLAEALVTIAIIIPVTLVLGDLFLLLVGSRENEAVCQNAARAAAAVKPAEAQQTAASMVQVSNNHVASGLICNFRLAEPVEVKFDPGTGGENNNELEAVYGTVTVKTEVEVKPLILNAFRRIDEPFKFRCSQSCPITYTRTLTRADYL